MPTRLAVFVALLTPVSAQDLSDVVARVSPCVVTIRTSGTRLSGVAIPRLEPATRVGSGIVLTASGEVLTAAHVVAAADAIRVEFVDGSSRGAVIRAMEPRADLALLRVQGDLPRSVTPGELGDSDEVRVGNRVFVIGAPMDLERTLTVGYVSARRQDERFLGSMRFVEHLQTDAAINSGNSGSPVFDLRGRVVGIVCHIVTNGAGNEGLGFAVTSNAARRYLLDKPPVWLGVEAEFLPAELAAALNVPGGRCGLLVTRVSPDSMASRAGLRGGAHPVRIGSRDLRLGGDIVMGVDGRRIGGTRELEVAVAELRGMKPEAELRLSVLRGGETIELLIRQCDR